MITSPSYLESQLDAIRISGSATTIDPPADGVWLRHIRVPQQRALNGRSGTLIAPSIQRDFMPFEHESIRHHPVHPSRTAVHVEDPVAAEAVEVVMVGRGDFSELIAVGLSRNRDPCHDILVLESIHGPIDGAHTERRDADTGVPVDLLDRHRPARLRDRVVNRCELPGVSPFGHRSAMPWPLRGDRPPHDARSVVPR